MIYSTIICRSWPAPSCRGRAARPAYVQFAKFQIEGLQSHIRIHIIESHVKRWQCHHCCQEMHAWKNSVSGPGGPASLDRASALGKRLEKACRTDMYIYIYIYTYIISYIYIYMIYVHIWYIYIYIWYIPEATTKKTPPEFPRPAVCVRGSHWLIITHTSFCHTEVCDDWDFTLVCRGCGEFVSTWCTALGQASHGRKRREVGTRRNGAGKRVNG